MVTLHALSTHSHTSLRVILQRLIDRLADLRWHAMRRERALVARELGRMGDVELRDLAISRSDIPAILDGSFRR